jgi:uncharacterized protein DUF6338
MITAEGVADTLRLLIPGFVALKLFYLFGLKTKRSDLEWTLWSVLVAAPLAATANWIANLIGQPATDLPGAFAKCAVDASRTSAPADLEGKLSACASQALNVHNADLRLAIALALALVLGLGASWIWRKAVKSNPGIARGASTTAWSALLREPHWIQVLLKDGRVISGYVAGAADSAETDALDLYLGEPAWVTQDSQGQATETRMTGVQGVLLSREEIHSILVRG